MTAGAPGGSHDPGAPDAVAPTSGAGITGHTAVAAVIGDPVAHSRSPAIHNAAFGACGLNWVFVALRTPAGHAAAAITAMRDLGLQGLSVTMPHKHDVAQLVDRLDPLAEHLGAVNCVVWSDGTLVGHNTDASGFVSSVAAAGHTLAGKRVGVLGAGGAARAVVAGSLGAGATDVVVINRSAQRAASAVGLDPTKCVGGVPGDVADVDVVVNATPVGMPDSPGIPPGAEFIHDAQVVVDLVYNPVATALLATARERGADSVDGLGMLIHQAADAFTLWTGQPAPLAAMERAARQAL